MPWDKIKDRDEGYHVQRGEIHGDADSCWKGQ